VVDDWDDTVAALPSAIGIDTAPRQGHLIVIRGNNIGETHPVPGPTMVIGRASGADLRLDDEGVSRFHCRLRHDGDEIFVEDLGSRNGTYCNGERIVSGKRQLAEGDRLQIGTTCVLRFTYLEVDMTPTPIPEEHGMLDPLTGAYSRRHFVDRLEREVSMAQEHKQPLSLVLIYVDRFPEYCTNRTRTIADEVTVGAYNHIHDNIRKDDIIARISDGEFALMMRATSPGDTFMQAERLRASTKDVTITTSSRPEQITLSIGIAAMAEVRADTAHDQFVAAGNALQRAKNVGGNRVVFCTQDLLQEPMNRTRI